MKVSDPTESEVAPKAILARLERLYHSPWRLDDRGVVSSINPRWWAGLYHTENHVIYGTDEGFFQFDDLEGVYLRVSPEQIREAVASRLLRAARDHSILGLSRQIRLCVVSSVVAFLQGIAEIREPFAASKGIVACDNGVLVLANGHANFHRFSPQFRVRDRIPVRYDPKSTCPTYDLEFMASVLDDEDVDLLHRHAGLVLAGVNPSHRLGILEGASGAGKSSFLSLLAEMVGTTRVTELRTEHLDKPFELDSFRGKILLSAADVGENFLNTPGAHTLKGLVSNDLFNPEGKNKTERAPLRGPFNVLIGTNCRLTYRSQGDSDAWRRRLIIYEWTAPPKDRRKIIDFIPKLLKAEGSGILNRFIDGYRRAWTELERTGDLVLSEMQTQRVEALVMRSEAMTVFVQNRLEFDSDSNVTSEEVLIAFIEFCQARGWIPPSERLIQLRMPELILAQFGRPRSNNLERNGRKNLRGWRGLRLIDDGARAFDEP